MNKKQLLSLLGILTVLGTAAQAAEKPRDIALNKEVKIRTITALQAAIARHKDMTQEQIVADLQSQVVKNLGVLAAHKIQVDPSAVQAELSALDKDTLIAVEQLKLQGLMTAENYVFKLTRETLTGAEAGADENGRYIKRNANVFVVGVAIVLECVIWPVEFLFSALTGF